MNMSATMTVFNLARTWARRSGLTDEGRVNRALGVLHKQGALERAIVKYGATVDYCQCPDASHQELVCKHRVAVMMFKRHQRILNDELGLDLSEDFVPTGDYEPELDPNESPEVLAGWYAHGAS